MNPECSKSLPTKIKDFQVHTRAVAGDKPYLSIECDKHGNVLVSVGGDGKYELFLLEVGGRYEKTRLAMRRAMGKILEDECEPLV